MCGASNQQKQIGAEQEAFYKLMTQQAQQVFGMASEVFKDLQATFAPIVAKGPNQEGFSAEEKANLDRQIIDSTGSAYNKAGNVLNSELASEGGGDVPVISGQANEMRGKLASSAAGQEAAEREQVTADSYATGRQNYFAAANALSGATNVFNPATGMSNAATGAGNAAASTANEIAQEDNSWVNATIGALGGVAGSVATGGMKNLGDTGSFWG